MTTKIEPWYAVAVPHEDIRRGKMEEAIFAANLWAVRQNNAPDIYLKPEAFFAKTHMTAGLGTLLSRVSSALSGGDAGDRIISLQTSFGGGKTHSLVALWHLAKHTETLRNSNDAGELRQVLKDRFPERVKGVAVFTNATCDATTGRETPEGVRTRTLWGELALQLGGPSLYEKVRAHDEAQRVPQGIFVDVLREAAPCLILLDELADYCVGAASVAVGETTLADQTISFIQQLTEAVQQVPGAVVVATLPASKYEVASSEKGQEAFVTLEKRFQRLGSDIKPVADDEIYEVVRRRLFETIAPANDPEYPTRVAEAYAAMYAQHANEVPAEVTKAEYRDLIRRAYPFHPLLIDALYTRWGSHPDFQRTRGVLRLLASIVGDLWERRETNTQSQPLIQPCHVRWTVDAMQAALTRYWGPAYQSVAAADVVGQRANSVLLDEERGGDYRRERISAGLAAAALLGSFGGQAERAGFDTKTLRVASARPTVNWNYADGALLELENRCFYLHFTSAGNLGKRYWFGTKANLNRLVITYRQQVSNTDFGPDILETLRSEVGSLKGGQPTWRVVVDPGLELPEQKQLTLVVLPPNLAWSDDASAQDALKNYVNEISTKCGRSDRKYRNTLLFLAPAARSLGRLKTAYRERRALQGVQRDYGDQIDREQEVDLKKRLQDAERVCTGTLGPAYTVVLRVAGTRVEPVVLTDARDAFPDHLSYVWTHLVEDEEWILRRVGSVTLQKSGLIPERDGLRLKDAVEAFLRYTDKPMLATKEAVVDGIAQACRDGVVGIGRGPTLNNLQATYCRQTVTLDASEEGLWIIPPFEVQPETPRADEEAAPTGGPVREPAKGEPTTAPTTGEAATKARAQPVRRITVQGAVPMESWSDVFRSFVAPAARIQLRQARLGIDFAFETGTAPLTADDPAVKAMKEAARQLGLRIVVEEATETEKGTASEAEKK